MTDDLTTTTSPVERVRATRTGKGAVMAGGVLSAVLIGFLLFGAVNAAGVMTAAGAARALPVEPAIEAPPNPVSGDESPESDDPSTPPDRNSDQTGAPTPEDEIYYIQYGDTLTELSAQFGMSVDAIANYNAVRDVNVISEGAVIRVPFIYVPPAPLAG